MGNEIISQERTFSPIYTTSNESAYYVAISRAREDVRIYTDDKAMLPEAMSRLDNKTAALAITQKQEREMALGG